MKRLIGLVCMCMTILWAPARGLNKVYVEYIRTYQEIAVGEMNKHSIPASITLAQGLLESAGGKSTLARYSNNHFGIKCGKTWKGGKSYHDDDKPNECFREYDDARQSFEDHSQFLLRNPRYASLFKLEVTDYKGWAHGLKKAGYATNPQYATLLINLIERYELHQYDRMHPKQAKQNHPKVIQTVKVVQQPRKQAGNHPVYLANGLAYITVRSGDTLESIAKEMDISAKNLRKYNDLYKGYVLKPGDVIYLKKKNRKAGKGYLTHVFREGESLHGISQKYGIRLSCLYKLNKLHPDADAPKTGYILRLR